MLRFNANPVCNVVLIEIEDGCWRLLPRRFSTRLAKPAAVVFTALIYLLTEFSGINSVLDGDQ